MSSIEVEVGVGDCPDRPEGFGHVWAGVKASGDERNPCRFCGCPGRDNVFRGESGGFFGLATARRTFLNVASPMQSGTGDQSKAYPKGLTPEMQARAAEIVEDKRRRDAEAVAAGTARPGQVAGVKGKRS